MFKKFKNINDIENGDLSFLRGSFIKDIGIVADSESGLNLLVLSTDNGSFVLEKNFNSQTNEEWLEALTIDTTGKIFNN